MTSPNTSKCPFEIRNDITTDWPNLDFSPRPRHQRKGHMPTQGRQEKEEQADAASFQTARRKCRHEAHHRHGKGRSQKSCARRRAVIIAAPKKTKTPIGEGGYRAMISREKNDGELVTSLSDEKIRNHIDECTQKQLKGMCIGRGLTYGSSNKNKLKDNLLKYLDDPEDPTVIHEHKASDRSRITRERYWANGSNFRAHQVDDEEGTLLCAFDNLHYEHPSIV
mmetsp:Transcript_22703/g.39933  ORF Transcript_22703/g.39933 Transcript_22703/m.39933 type:complete len:223 (+) Transcript_22703:331-999(+)